MTPATNLQHSEGVLGVAAVGHRHFRRVRATHIKVHKLNQGWGGDKRVTSELASHHDLQGVAVVG
jgi:hypothetical protein